MIYYSIYFVVNFVLQVRDVILLVVVKVVAAVVFVAVAVHDGMMLLYLLLQKNYFDSLKDERRSLVNFVGYLYVYERIQVHP